MNDNGALRPADVALCWELYCRAVLRTYSPWADARDVRWLPRAERERAERAVNVARRNLSALNVAQRDDSEGLEHA